VWAANNSAGRRQCGHYLYSSADGRPGTENKNNENRAGKDLKTKLLVLPLIKLRWEKGTGKGMMIGEDSYVVNLMPEFFLRPSPIQQVFGCTLGGPPGIPVRLTVLRR
jgi:hypothetical protein